MLIAEPTIQPGFYRLPDFPIGQQVLIPGFRAARSVRGAFGWFTAGWIGRLAPGLADYLNQEGPNPITFTVAPVLYPRERDVIDNAGTMTPEEASQRIAHVFIDGRVDADALGQHALDCLAWMIAVGLLHLRVVVPTPMSNYHPKMWLFNDGQHQVLVRGSANATGRGIEGAVEHMDVDVSWADNGQRIEEGNAALDDWEEGRSPGIERVVDIPDAIREGIVKTAPPTAPTPADYNRAALLAESTRPGYSQRDLTPAEKLRARLRSSRSSQKQPRLKIPQWLKWQTGKYAHQGEAVGAWEAAGQRGTISMATGAGKTFTSLICATRAQDHLGSRPFLIIVSAPSRVLIKQWAKEIKSFNINAVTPTMSANRADTTTNLLRSLGTDGTRVAVVTNNLLCSPDFQRTVTTYLDNAHRPVATMLIGDEAHSLGAEGFLANRPTFFELRVALSATPERQYDPDGTEGIFEFFGPEVYKFGLDRAIGFCLVPYDYYVHVSVLGGDELDEFADLTRRIGRAMAWADDEETDDTVKRLLIRRRRIIETGPAKLPLLRTVLRHRGPRYLDRSLVYASAKNPEHFDDISGILDESGIRWAPVTEDTTSKPAVLKDTLETFSAGGYQTLLAKKVLDEGVDIPGTREAFLVASSTIEREWVQRRGRILRRHPGKDYAVLHDFLALPPASLVRGADRDLGRIVHQELDRALSFAAHSRNATGKNGVFAHLNNIREAYWPEGRIGSRTILQVEGDALMAPNTPRGTLR